MELIGLAGIRFAYDGRPEVLSGLDFSLDEKDRLGIEGPNGAGKSTMFQVAMGLLPPTAGEVRGLGRAMKGEKDFRELRRAVGYLFQDPDDQLFCPTVVEDVAFGPLNLGMGKDRALEVVGETLASLGLSGYEERITHQLSGGEKRLVSLAAVLAMRPRALLLDEPSTGLDPDSLGRLEAALLSTDLSWAVVSHDQEFLRRISTRLMELREGRLREV